MTSGESTYPRFRRSMFTDGSLRIPKKWICNIRKEHDSFELKSGADSPDYPTKEVPCSCVDCIEIEPHYRLGQPIVTNKSFPASYIKEKFMGLYWKGEIPKDE